MLETTCVVILLLKLHSLQFLVGQLYVYTFHQYSIETMYMQKIYEFVTRITPGLVFGVIYLIMRHCTIP